jgi:type I restriction enzyme R subunit
VERWRPRRKPENIGYNNAIADAVADLGRPEEIGRVFCGFRKYLYQQTAA